MNAAAALVMVVLSGQGYWFQGQRGTVEIAWVLGQEMPGAEVIWRLQLGEATVTSGRAPMPATGAAIRIEAPAVRARTAMRWMFEVRDEGGRLLSSGERTIHVFPTRMLDGLARRLGERKLLLLDPDGQLAPLLREAGVPHELVTESTLRLRQADLVMVAPDALDASPFSQAPLIGQARGGASVFLFAQHRPDRLAEFAVRDRPVAPLKWREDHVLFSGLDSQDLQRWIDRGEVRAIQLPADEPALELAWWPEAARGKQPGPIEALAVTQRVGDGRIVLWQVPLGSFDSDPRSQMLLRNAIDFLLAPVELTPPPSERHEPAAPEPVVVPTIRISPGDER
jgi:hypothetical protein